MNRTPMHSLSLTMETVDAYFTYMEPCGSIYNRDLWAFRRGDTLRHGGTTYTVMELWFETRYLDGGARPFTVRLRCRPL